MAQHDLNIANQVPANLRTDLNNALSAIATNNSGGSAPSTTYANQWWYDTTNDLLKIRNEADTAWITLGTLNQSSNSFETAATNSVKNNEDKNLTAGYTATADDDGTKSSGTYTPSPVGGNLKRIINGGAFTLAAPTYAGDYTMIIQMTNNASAGVITVSGFTKASGDPTTTTDGHDFLLHIVKINSFKTLYIEALQ